MKENDRFKREKLLEIQQKKVINLVQHAYKHSDYYREVLDNNGIKIDSIKSIMDLKRIPILTKKMLRENIDKIRVKNNNKYTVAKTSGSTGKVLKFIKDRQATAVHNSSYYRGLSWHGLDIGAKEAMLWGVPVNKLVEIKSRLIDFALNRFREKEYNLNNDILYDFYKKLLKKRPQILSGYSSMVVQFALFLKNNNLNGKNIGIKIVKCTSETVNDGDYKLIYDVFGCPLVVEYGAAETNIVAFSCEKGNIHLFSDYVLTEFENHSEENIDPEYKELIVTSLYNYSLPIIRYKIGDFAIQKEGYCKCGKELPMVEKIIGRTSALVYGTDGSRFHSIIFYYIFKGLQDKKIGGVSQFQVIQESKNRLIMNLVKDESFSSKTIDYISEKVKEKLGINIKIEFNIVDIIAREKSGKIRDFISNLENELTVSSP
jgi:phenylacetate-CoA ligase